MWPLRRYRDYVKDPVSGELIIPRRTRYDHKKRANIERCAKMCPESSEEREQTSSPQDFDELRAEDEDVGKYQYERNAMEIDDLREAFPLDGSSDTSSPIPTSTADTLSPEELAFLWLDIQSWRKFHGTKQRLDSDLRVNALRMKRLHPDSEYPRSIYLLKKQFYDPGINPLSVHYICKEHGLLLGSTFLEERSNYTYPCRHDPEETHYVAADKASSMICGSLEHQVTRMISMHKEKIVEGLRKRKYFAPLSNISDVVEGKYLQHIKTGIGEHDLTLIVHSDGAQVAISSSAKSYLVHFTIAELAATTRNSVAAWHTAWVGECDDMPHRATLLHPFIEQLTKLSTEGVEVNLFGILERIRIYPVLWASDSMERFFLAGLSIMHHLFGCTMCEAETVVWTDPKNARSHHQVFPVATMNAAKRRDSKIMALADRLMQYEPEEREIVRNDRYYCRVTERSVLAPLRKFHLVDSLVPDIMHLFYKGLAPNCYSACPQLKNKTSVHLLDPRTRCLDVPSAFSHKLRSFKDASIFKANDWRDAVFISPYLFFGILPDPAFNVWCLLYCICYLTSKNDLSQDGIGLLDQYARQFNFAAAEVFGEEFLTYNVHQVLHLADACRNFGPASGYSGFAFENHIGTAMRSVKGYNKIIREIGNTQVLYQIADSIAETLESMELPEDLSDEISRLSHKKFHSTAVYARGAILYGKPDEINVLPESALDALREHFLERGSAVHLVDIKVYNSVIIDKYDLSTKRSRTDNYAQSLIYVEENIVRVRHILLHGPEDQVGACLLVCQTTRTIADTPYSSVCPLPGMVIGQWENRMSVHSVSEFSGTAIELPYSDQWVVFSKLPKILFQGD